MARAGDRAASDTGCLSGQGTQPCLQRVGARSEEGGSADPDSLYAYTLPSLVLAVADDDVG